MGRLIKAEFRKILTTKQWWILLLVAAVAVLGWSWLLTAAFEDFITEAEQELPAEQRDRLGGISWSAMFLTRGINLGTIFPMLFGGLALATELRHKTVTTSLLTAPNRPMLLTAKAITYLLWGVIFGVTITLAASLGTVLGGSEHLVSFQAWLAIAVAGIVSCVLWTLLGLGVGALIGSTVGTAITLLVYGLAVGPISDIVLTSFAGGDPNVAGALPNGSANGLTGATASNILADEVRDAAGGAVPPDIIDNLESVVRALAGGLGSFGLWASAAIFLAWALAFLGGGMARTQLRDVT